ncbi:hypothetical protein Goari_014679 [Gossypium aridum]|uniref:DUF4283 domain-containing protein n=1 Tax=Gossypium aridum TaxID=34290 RepID=A0A7J8XII4_GOSAI|nr:hypothetical protein [Gossypium aridum]
MRNTMANLWYPLEGVEILELGAKWFLFKFFHKVDVDHVISDAPWTFNGHLLVFHWLREEDGPLTIPLVSSTFWFQVYNLPPRRVAMTNNIWLWDEGSELVLGDTLRGR